MAEGGEGEGDGEELEVEAIVGHIEINGATLYQVRWKGYAAEDDTYEPLDHLAGCDSLLEKYLHSLKPDNEKSGSNARKASNPKRSRLRDKAAGPPSSSDLEAHKPSLDPPHAEVGTQPRPIEPHSRGASASSARPIVTRSRAWSDESLEVWDDGATPGTKLVSQEATSQRKSRAGKDRREAAVTNRSKGKKQKSRSGGRLRPSAAELIPATAKAAHDPQQERKTKAAAPIPISDTSLIWSSLRLNVRFYESDLFPVPLPPPVPVRVIEAESRVTAELINPFPVRSIEAIRMKREVPQLLCQQPDQLESVWLPLALVEILQPELVYAFFAKAESAI
jgi:hypothetical protein